MVCDWSEIGLTTVRDVTDSFHRLILLALLSVKPLTKKCKSLQFKFLQNGRIKGNQIHEAV